MKTLNVIKISRNELEEKWGFNPLIPGRELFIRCNSKGEVNWDKAPVYSWREISSEQKRRPVHFLIPKEEIDFMKNF